MSFLRRLKAQYDKIPPNGKILMGFCLQISGLALVVMADVVATRICAWFQ